MYSNLWNMYFYYLDKLFWIYFSQTISECVEIWSGLLRAAMYFGRFENGRFLVGVGSFSSSSCFLADLRGLFVLHGLDGRTSGRDVPVSSYAWCTRVRISAIEIRLCCRRRRRVNVTRMSFSTTSHTGDCTRKPAFAGDARRVRFDCCSWVHISSNIFQHSFSFLFPYFFFLHCFFFTEMTYSGHYMWKQ